MSKPKVSRRKVKEVFHDVTFDKERAQQLLRERRALAARARDGRADVSRHGECHREDRRAGPRRVRRHPHRSRRGARGPLLLQLLALPVAARQLGHRPALPDHADSSAERRADAPRHAAGHHLRLRRKDRPLRRREGGQPVARAARVARRRAVHARRLSHRRVSGDPRRSAQPVRRHERGAHSAGRQRATRSRISCTATR